MSQHIGLSWNEKQLHVVVVRHHLAKSHLEHTLTVAVSDPGDATSLGHQLGEVVAPLATANTKYIVGVNRESLDWRHLTLPPCPEEDLPDLVRMQMMQESSNGTVETGFDYLPLSGDEENSHRLWFISLKPFEMDKINKVCEVAHIKPARIVPLSLGYPVLETPQHGTENDSIEIFVAPNSAEATLWASQKHQTLLFRQLHLPPQTESESLVSAVTGELRRSKLALSQQFPDSESQIIQLVGIASPQLNALAEALGESLGQRTSVLDIPLEFGQETPPSEASLPLIGLALQDSQGQAPLADLLNPRKRPTTKSRRSTTVLLAAACIAVLALFGWQSYSKLQSPLRDAESAEAQIGHLEESIDSYALAEKKEKSIQDWLNHSTNLLSTMEQLSEILRPVALDAESFSPEEDTVLESFDITGRKLTIRGAVRKGVRVPPLEAELRKHSKRVQREESEPDQDIPEYPWGYKFIVDVAEQTGDKEQPSS